MALQRSTVDRIAELAAAALIRELEEAEKAGTKVHPATLANVVKMLSKIQISLDSKAQPIIPEMEKVSKSPEEKRARLERLAKVIKMPGYE